MIVLYNIKKGFKVSKSSFKKIIWGSLVALALFTGFMAYWNPGFLKGILILVASYWVLFIILLLGLLVAVKLFKNGKATVSWAVLFLTAIAPVAILPIGSFSRAAYYAQSVSVTTDSEPSFSERAPFDVASAVSSASIGDTGGNSTGAVKSITGKGTYSVSVIKRGFGQGYEKTVEMNVPTMGTASVERDTQSCEFNSDTANLRLSGRLPWNNLGRAITYKTGLLTGYTKRDAFATCENGVPMVYVPLLKPSFKANFFFPVDVPAGVAIYNGHTGELVVKDSVEGTNLPVYSQYISEQQHESTAAIDGFWSYIFKRAGWDTTNKDDSDPNYSNPADFGLKLEDGTSTMVTPLTPRGSSTNIVGLAVVESNKISANNLNQMKIYRYTEPMNSTTQLAQRINTELFEGYKMGQMEVFEIVPGQNGNWVATVGSNQTISYRVSINKDGTITLNDKEKGAEPIESEPNKDKVLATSESGKPLSEMTDEEIKEMVNQAMDELSKR